MSIEDTIGYQSDERMCIVCGKGLKPGEALATLHDQQSIPESHDKGAEPDVEPEVGEKVKRIPRQVYRWHPA